MAKRIFEYVCEHGHRTEQYVEETCVLVQCKECQSSARRIISAPRIGLEGVTGAFPTASDRWARVHEEATAKARKRAADHGPTPIPGVKY